VAIGTQQVSVGTTATRLDPTPVGAITRESCVVRNRGAAAVFLGGSTVTTANGFQLDPGETFTADVQASDGLFGIVASGTVVCHVLQVGGV
jgi:hypothetical protein